MVDKLLKKAKKKFIKSMQQMAGVDRSSDQRKLGTYEDLYGNPKPHKKKKKKGK